MGEFNADFSSANNNIEIRQGNQNNSNATVSILPATQLNLMATNIATNGNFGIYSRNVPQVGRIFKANTPTTIHLVNSNNFPSGLTAVYIKLRYRVYDQTNYI